MSHSMGHNGHNSNERMIMKNGEQVTCPCGSDTFKPVQMGKKALNEVVFYTVLACNVCGVPFDAKNLSKRDEDQQL
jgi:hypothetical protein